MSEENLCDPPGVDPEMHTQIMSATSSVINLPSGKLAAVTRKRNEITTYLEKSVPPNKSVLTKMYGEFLEKFEVLLSACNELSPTLDELGRKKLESWFQENNEPIAQFRLLIDKILKEISVPDSLSNWEKGSNDGSNKSSTTSSARIRLAEKRAKAEAQRLYQEKLDQLEEQELKQRHEEEARQAEFKRKRRQLQQEQEAVEDSLMDQELNKLEDNFDNMNVNKVDALNYSIPKNIYGPASNIVNNVDLVEVLKKQNEISITLARSQERGSLPKKEIRVFDGKDLTLFRSFIQTFRRVIEDKCDDDSDKLYYLEQYTEGGAKELVRSCSYYDATRGYKEAIKLLQEEYGNEYKISASYLDKLEQWPLIKPEDGESLRQLSIFLLTCSNYMEDMNSLNQLQSPKEIKNIVMKLPYDLRRKWRDKTLSLNENGYPVTFKNLVQFITRQANVLNQPLFGDIRDAQTKPQQKSLFNLSTAKKRSLTTRRSKETEDKKCVNSSKYCFCCKMNNHVLNKCRYLEQKIISDRVEFIKKSGLCFACLEPGHTSRGCSNRLTCETCNRKHPTILHDETKIKKEIKSGSSEEIQDETSDTSLQKEARDPTEAERPYSSCYHTGAGDSSTVKCSIVPVRLRVKGKKSFVETYAALDGQSTSCFMEESLLRKLGIDAKESTLCLSTMENQKATIETKIVHNLELHDYDGQLQDVIPITFAKKNWPFSNIDIPSANIIKKFPYLNQVPFRYINAKVGLLIGMNMPEMIKPLQVIDGPWNAPYATQHRLGWGLNGPVEAEKGVASMCHRITAVQLQEIEEELQEFYSSDFTDSHIDALEMSQEDKTWESKVKGNLKLRSDGHYEIDLPFRDDEVIFPSNREQVYRMFGSLRRRFEKNAEFFSDYKEFMNMMLTNKFMEKIPNEELMVEKGRVWYINHHGVYHKQKQKIRVVFNCSMKFKGISLNDKLLQGPDLTSSLLGVLIRFRQGKIAFTADIAKMFYQVKVPTKHANFLRFFWLPNDSLREEPEEFRLTVHVFGAVSSPSVSNYALRQTTIDNPESNAEARETIKKHFYVDDWLRSMDNEDAAVELIQDVTNLIEKGGFNITGFLSNSRRVLSSLPTDKLAKDIKTLDVIHEDLPFNRALGVIWNLEKDTMGFKINLENKPITRRGILSTIHSIYDPIGLSGPAIIPAKRIFQETCRLQLDWNEELPKDLAERWKRWTNEIPLLLDYEIPRCYKKGEIKHAEVHYFSDGSETAFGSIAFMRFLTKDDRIHCAPVIAKARLTPLNNKTLKTIPRIELNAAKLSIILQQILHRELEIEVDSEYFWTDSLTVLKYIRNESSRFMRFVANRITFIRSHTNKQQWNYVPSILNPADHISRGVSVPKFLLLNNWKHGPDFLWEGKSNWPKSEDVEGILESDPEIKQGVAVHTIKLQKTINAIDKIIQSSSDLNRLKVKVAWFLRLKKILFHKTRNESRTITLQELGNAELTIWKYTQEVTFSETIKLVKEEKNLPKANCLRKLNPVLDEEGLLRVGGRLGRTNAEYSVKHPIILPKDNHAVKLLIRNIHVLVGHLGRESILSTLRRKFWVVGATSSIRKIVRECVACRKRQGKPSQQIMASLPADRVKGDKPPFTSTGIDYFGPFHVIKGRKTEKRYGVIFTCMASRAMHLEISFSLTTDSFIHAFRRFLVRRGTVEIVRSDNGTNFTSGNKELKEALGKWNLLAIENWMKQKNLDWKFQPPAASHFGGVWEREIRSIRKVLSALMKEQPMRLNDEELNTLMCEVEGILNNRPLTEISSDPSDLECLTPNHLLLQRSGVTFPPGLFEKNDMYSKRRWRQVQYLADLFWSRWRKEYLPLLQLRQNWTRNKEPHEIGDLVLVVDQLLPRNQWSLGRISEVMKDKEGKVRSAKIKVAKYRNSKKTGFGTVEIERPIVKLVLLKSLENL